MKVEDRAFNAVLFCNRAAAHHALSKYIDAIADCFTAAALDASYVRVLQRRADAYVALGDHTNAAQVWYSVAQFLLHVDNAAEFRHKCCERPTAKPWYQHQTKKALVLCMLVHLRC